MIGDQIGQYKIVAAIGQGGMATVYKAYQSAFDRYVAIKVLSRQFSEDPTFVKRFQREARVVAKIEHKSIVPMYDYGEEEGLYYIVMRLIEGGTLRKKMFYEKIDLATAAHIIQQVAEALDFAHQHDVIHRDLKPSNILIDERGNAYLTDFGIAKMLGSNTQVTQSGVVGTPSYMSPEQCQGKELGPASDIYSLGTILFEVLTGQVPYEADTPLSVMYMHVRDPIPSARALNPKLPAAIDRLFMRVLAKQPNDRYPTAVAMVADFRQIAGLPDEDVITRQPEKRSVLGGLFKRQPAPSAPPAPVAVEPSVPQAVVEREQATLRSGSAAGDASVPEYQDYDQEPYPRRQPRSASQSLLAGAVGVIALLGLVGAGIVGMSTLDNQGRPALVPTLPPTHIPTVPVFATQTPIYRIVTGQAPTAAPPTAGGVIIEPSATPTFTLTPLALVIPSATNRPLPTSTPALPTITPVPPSATPIPPTNTPVPPTDTPVPPTDTPTPTVLKGHIAYTEGENNAAEIVVVDANGQNRQQLTNDNQDESEPDWSKDGTRIAYEATVGGLTDIYTMNASGGDIQKVTTANEPDRHPDWSPDATWITYESGTDEAAEIYASHPDGSGLVRLTNNSYSDRAPKFSPDGTQIAYMTHQRGKWEIAIMAFPGGNQVKLFDCPAPACRFPSWSPDGTQIAFNTLTSDIGTEAGIWTLDVATGGSTPVLQGSQDGRPVYSGNGKVIYFNRTINGDANIFRVILATGTILQLTNSQNQAVGPDWSP